MKAASSIFILLLAVTVCAEPQLLQIRELKGWNTVAGDFAIKPNEARICHNIDLGENVGAITKRDGYDSVHCLPGMDSIVGIYGAFFSDGTQKMVYVCDSTGLDYGGVWLSAQGRVDTATRLWPYFSVQNKPSFTMIDDNIYVVNGSHRGVVVSNGGAIARSYPLQAPGEPLIVPLSVTDGELDGEYRYVFRVRIYYNSVQFTVASNSIVTAPVSVKHGRILLTRFQEVIDDSVIINGIDSIYIYPYRTTANPGPLDVTDSVFSIGYYLFWTPDSSLGSMTLIDSVADSIIDTASSRFNAVEPGAWSGRDSTKSVGRRYGSPSFVAGSSASPGIFAGWPSTQLDTLGIAYACTFIDTVTGIESDTGRSLFVLCDSGDSGPSFGQVELKLPRIPTTDSGIVLNLYRACILQLTHEDSTRPTRDPRLGIIDVPWIVTLAVDSQYVGEYYLLKQFSSGDTIFTDDVPYDSLVTDNRRIYHRKGPPAILSTIFSHEGRLFGLEKSGLYYTVPTLTDTLQSWGQMNLTPINPDDGDAVTTAWPVRGVVRVMKSYSNFNVYQGTQTGIFGDLLWNKTELSGYFGCIAGNSHAGAISGHYYLSKEGVLREQEGAYLERTNTIEKLSAPLNNFDNLDIVTASQAVGFYYDHKYLLCIGDTTYVYDELANGWGSWGFTFTDATLYGTEDEVRFLPGDTMYFIKTGDSTLYRFGTSETDKGTAVQVTWKTGPLLIDQHYKHIVKMGLWAQTEDTTSNHIRVALYDEEGTVLTYTDFTPLDQRYRVNGIGDNEALYYQFILTTGNNQNIENAVVDGLDIWYNVVSEHTIE